VFATTNPEMTNPEMRKAGYKVSNH